MPKVNRKSPKENHWHTICFDCEEWSDADKCRKWLKDNDFYSDGLHTTDKYYRFVQYDIEDKEAYDLFWKTMSKDKGLYGIYAVYKKDDQEDAV